MNTASLELCKELYELSGWGDGTDMNMLSWLDYYDDWSVPAYDLGYLLRKLPPSIKPEAKPYLLTLRPNYSGSAFTVLYEDPKNNEAAVQLFANTPENAATQLAIELFKQGILTKEATK